MHDYRWDLKNTLGGLLLVAIGLYFLIGALQMPMGTPRRLGPGVYPALLAAVAIVMGAILTFQAIRRAGTVPQVYWRAAAGILAGILTFYFGFVYLGMIPATFGAMLVASYADHDVKLLRAVLLAAGTAVAVWLIFTVGLTLPLPAFQGLL